MTYAKDLVNRHETARLIPNYKPDTTSKPIPNGDQLLITLHR